MGTHDLRLRLAQIAGVEGRQSEAIGLYAQILRGNPYLVEAWWGLSQVVGEPARILECLNRVLALQPGHIDAERWRAALTGKSVRGNYPSLASADSGD